MKRLRRVWNDVQFLEFMDRGEQQLAKVLSLVLLVVMVAATLQLIWQVGWALTSPSTPWMSSRLNQVLGDLLTLMIALEVLQNITSYLRRHVVQIELVLLTAMTAVARKVIVLPYGNNQPELLAGLGLAVLALGGGLLVGAHGQPASAGGQNRASQTQPGAGSVDSTRWRRPALIKRQSPWPSWRGTTSSANCNWALPCSSTTHSCSLWLYQKSGGLDDWQE